MLKRWADWPRGIRWLTGGIAAVVLAAAVSWWLLVPAADWLARHDVGSAKASQLQTARDAARGRLLTLGAGLLAGGALLFTARTFTLSREGQVTDRYTNAIGQLGSKELDVRIGGIYALERIARDSDKDHPTVMEVLTAFVHEHCREPWPPSADDEPGADDSKRRMRRDVQAAVTVIGRRKARYDRRPVNLVGADLTGAYLRGAYFRGVDLTDAYLTKADLEGADLGGARLIRAHLRMARLHRADLTAAHLSDADLTGADLRDAHLCAANLTNARLTAARLGRADLRGVILTGAYFGSAQLYRADLTGADLTGADFTAADLDGAKWPGNVQAPPTWVPGRTGRLEREGTDSEPTKAN